MDKYPSLISYHGKYFYRSDSMMRMIAGKELDKVILKSQGKTWDDMPIPKLRVAMLAFYKDQVNGLHVPILRAAIERVEQFMFHQDAFREILLNAVVHKDYSGCNPIQISVYEDKIYIWNDGKMPSELDSTDKLFMKHSSKPYNPKLAGVFFKSGMIEAWGRGFDKIREACAKYDGPLPEYNISASGIMVLCKACDKYLELLHGELHPVQSEQDIVNLNELLRGGNDCEDQNYSSTDGGGISIGNTDRLWSGRFGAG